MRRIQVWLWCGLFLCLSPYLPLSASLRLRVSPAEASCTNTPNLGLCKAARGDLDWDLIQDGNWDTLDSRFGASGGKVPPGYGGTGIDSSASTGIPHVSNGVWSMVFDSHYVEDQVGATCGAKLQAAYNALPVTSGTRRGTLVLPEGDCAITSQVTFDKPDGVVLIGSGSGILYQGSRLIASGGFAGTLLRLDGPRYIHFSGFEIDCNSTAARGLDLRNKSGYGSFGSAFDHMQISRCTDRGAALGDQTADGFSFNMSENRFLNVRFRSNATDIVIDADAAVDNNCTNCEFTTPTTRAIYVKRGSFAVLGESTVSGTLSAEAVRVDDGSFYADGFYLEPGPVPCLKAYNANLDGTVQINRMFCANARASDNRAIEVKGLGPVSITNSTLLGHIHVGQDVTAFRSHGNRFPLTQDHPITAVADNGAGLVRVTMVEQHSYATGYTVDITGVQGATGANGSWIVTKVTNYVVDLQGSAFGGAYTTGGVARLLKYSFAASGANQLTVSIRDQDGYTLEGALNSTRTLAAGDTGNPDTTYNYTVLAPNGITDMSQSPARVWRAATVVATGGSGTNYGYKVTAVNAEGESLVNTEGTVSGGAVLGGGVYNTITWEHVAVLQTNTLSIFYRYPITQYKVYRTTSAGTPSSTGLIGTVYGQTGAVWSFVDTGIAATTAPPTRDTATTAKVNRLHAGTGGLVVDGPSTLTGTATLSGSPNIASAPTFAAGTGSGIAAVTGTLCSNVTAATTTGTSEQVLASCEIQANTLSANGKWLRVLTLARHANNANSGIIQVRWGGTGVDGTRIALSGSATTANAGYALTGYVARVTSGTQILSQGSETDSGAGTLSETAAITIYVTGATATQAGDVTFQGLFVEVVN